MPLKAKSSKNFLLRMALLAVCLSGFSLWFFYDGTVTYPHTQQRAVKYLEFKEKDQLDQWKVYATEQGWSTDDPGKPKHDVEFYYLTDSIPIHIPQYIFGGIVVPFALLFLVIVIRASRRWIELDETGIRTSWGRQLEFDQIVALDKKLWRKKGIAKIFYKDNKRKRRVVLDDCKYDVETTKAILIEVESRIGYDKIIGGPPEAIAQTEPQPESEEQTEQSAE